MAHFAHVNSNSIVDEVIVADQDFINSGHVGNPQEWFQTSYNTHGGIHYKPDSTEPSEDQSKALRKNYAGLGYTYDAQRDAFISPKPYNSWSLNEFSCLWEAPVPRPTDGPYTWDEDTLSWKRIDFL